MLYWSLQKGVGLSIHSRTGLGQTPPRKPLLCPDAKETAANSKQTLLCLCGHFSPQEEKTVMKVVKGAEDPEAFTVRILAALPLVSDKSETQYLKSRRGCW